MTVTDSIALQQYAQYLVLTLGCRRPRSHSVIIVILCTFIDPSKMFVHIYG